MRSLIVATSFILVALRTLAAIPAEERSALIVLYEETGGTEWSDSTGWLGDPGTECDWFGVTCDGAGEQVTDIYLESNNLSGTVPAELSNLTALDTLTLVRGEISGPIPSELGSLTGLRVLNLYLNRLSGTIPPELGNLGSLEALNLFANDLDGAIPKELGNLTNLTVLGLSGNRLDGSIPVDLGRLSALEELNISGNQISGSIPSELGSLTNLRILRLSNNRLAGGIPDTIGGLAALEELFLSRNRLSGPIPASVGNLGSLVVLNLAENDLAGPIPSTLGSLSNLKALFLSDNDLGGTIPASLGNLDNLVELDLMAARLTGSIPAELASLPALESLILGQSYNFGTRNNRLTGGIPEELSQLSTLRELTLGFNQLGGAIPSALGDLSNLERLDLSANDLTGPIPPELGRLARLERLTLAFNSLSGTIPVELAQLAALTGLDLEVNELTGRIPPELGDLTQLMDLLLNKNHLTGPIPPELGRLTALETLYLNTNALTGTIPDTMANLTALATLVLFGNDLEGPIPVWLGNLTNLTDLLLDGNRFTGPIPPQITDLVHLSSFGVGDNLLSGELPSDIGKLTEMAYLSLDSAGLSGELPESFWKMTKLIDARLENNDFTGTLSPDIREMSALELLLLSGNQIGGTLPPELGDLSSILILGLDGNRLTGSIPPELGNAVTLVFLGLEKNALGGDVPRELTNLEALQQVRFGFNALTTSDPAVRDFIDERNEDGPFGDTQTVPPTGVAVSALTDRSAVVSWNPIVYDENDGGYEVRAVPAGGGSTIVSTTGSKRVGSHIVRGLEASTTYEITVRTTTHPFGFQQNFLRSAPSPPVTATTTERQTVPAEVDLVSGPSGLIQVGGVPQNEDSYVLGNFGDVATTITLERIGDHFEQEPESFVLEPGATQTVTLRSVPDQPPDSYWGYSVVLGDGVAEEFLVPVILLSTPPSAGVAVGEAVTSRVDVYGFEGTDGIGTARFRNRGTSTLEGVLVSDSAWIRTAAEPITIPPGEVRAVSFDVLRSRRPAARGAVTGLVRLIYVASSAGKGEVDPRNGSTTVSTTLVTVVDTVVPESRPAAVPDLEAGEVRRLIAGVSHATRSTGIFLSDLSVTNALGSRPLDDLEIFFDPRGQAPSSAASAGTLEPSTSLTLANIVQSVYGDDERTGTIHVRTSESERLQVEASLSNVGSTLGEMRGSLPVFRTDRVVEAGQASYLMDLDATGDLETILFIQEAAGFPASLVVEYQTADGELIESVDLELGRFELRELVDSAPAGTELVRIECLEDSEGAFVAYALVIDRNTGSVSTIVDWRSVFGYPAGETVRIPIVIEETAGEGPAKISASEGEGRRRRPVRRPEPAPTAVRTSVTVMNPGTTEAIVELSYHESTGSTYRHRKEIAPGGMVTLDDVASVIRGRSGPSRGFAVAEMVSGSSIVTAAVIRRTATADFVSTIPVMAGSMGLRLGQSVAFKGLEDSTAESVLSKRTGTRRTGFGITETGGGEVTVRVTIGIGGKNPLVSSTFSKELSLPAYGSTFASDLLLSILGEQRETLLGDVKNVQLSFTVIDGDGAVTAFVQETDNGSGDTRYLF